MVKKQNQCCIWTLHTLPPCAYSLTLMYDWVNNVNCGVHRVHLNTWTILLFYRLCIYWANFAWRVCRPCWLFLEPEIAPVWQFVASEKNLFGKFWLQKPQLYWDSWPLTQHHSGDIWLQKQICIKEKSSPNWCWFWSEWLIYLGLLADSAPIITFL